MKMMRDVLPSLCALAVSLASPAAAATPRMADIPAGSFEMGDHHGFVDPKHGGDETPVHTVRLDAFQIGVFDVTTREYCEFLNAALADKTLEVRNGGVYRVGGSDLLCETRDMSPFSRIGWDGGSFSVLDHKEDHPVVCIRWPGAALFCSSSGRRLTEAYVRRLPPRLKSTHHTWSLCSLRRRTMPLAEWPRRRLLCCFAGTLKPSRFHSR